MWMEASEPGPLAQAEMVTKAQVAAHGQTEADGADDVPGATSDYLSLQIRVNR